MAGADGVGAIVGAAPVFAKAVVGLVADVPFAVGSVGGCVTGAVRGVGAAGGLAAAGGCACCCTGERGGTDFAASSLAFCASTRAASSAARRFFWDSTSSWANLTFSSAILRRSALRRVCSRRAAWASCSWLNW